MCLSFRALLWLGYTCAAIICVQQSTSGMALLENRKLYDIAQVDLGLRLWTVKIQVVESHRAQQGNGRNNPFPKTYKRYMLVDEHGTKVSAMVYENDFNFFSTSLQPFRRYFISNARLTPAYAFFRVGPYPFSWIISNETPVEPIEEPIPPTLPFSYDVCPFDQFVNHADKESGFNVKGIIVHAFPRRQVNLQSSHREFVIVDESKRPMILTLWNSYGDVEGIMIANSLGNQPIFVGLNMKSTTFHGLSLGTRMYSCILVDPPTPDAPALRQWYNNNKAEITEMVNTRAYRNTDLLLPPPSLSTAIDVPTAAATLHTIKTAWVTGQLRFTVSRQQYYLCACANCYHKAATGADWFLKCSACGSEGEVILRCKVPVQLTGGDRTMQLVLTSPDVERLTGVTSQQLRDAHEFDFNVDDELHVGLDKLEVVCFIKKYDRATMGNAPTPGIRFSVVKTYARSALETPTGLPATPSKPMLTEGGPSGEKQPMFGECPSDDKQLFTPKTVKGMTEVDGVEVPEKPDYPSPAAKRGLDFISADIEKAKDHPLGETTTSAQGFDDNESAPVGGSPMKKIKDKLKQS